MSAQITVGGMVDGPPSVPCPSIHAIGRPPEPGHGVLHVGTHTAADADLYEVMDSRGREFAEGVLRLADEARVA